MSSLAVPNPCSLSSFWFPTSLKDEEAVKKLAVKPGTKSKLPKPVQELVGMIFDVESMKKALVEYEVRIEAMLSARFFALSLASSTVLLSLSKTQVATNVHPAQRPLAPLTLWWDAWWTVEDCPGPRAPIACCHFDFCVR